tara:strand:+ start:345 stop:1547 length:1203 start_codon:yes stop_codon:yes gene_type:complete
MSQKVTCPNCNEEFPLEEGLKNHLKSYEEKIKKEQSEKSKEEVKKLEKELKSKEKKISDARSEGEKSAANKLEEKHRKELEKKDNQVQAAIDKGVKKREAELKDKIKNELKVENDEKLEEEKEKNRNLKKEKQIQDERNLKKIAELESNLKQKSVELQGEIQEERLQDILEDLFPEDDFEDISKGKKGGDCIQTINYKNKTKIAKIYFESKDVKSFSEEWPDKLLKDMNAKGVANGIIVCSLRCMPKDYSKRISKVNRLGNSITIIPFVRQTIHAVIDGIRSILILKARENKEHEIPAVMQKCYQNLNSPNFTTPIKIMVSEIKRMEDQFDSDVRSHELSMAKKKKFLSSIQKSLYDAVTSFITIDTNIFPENLLIPQENIKKLKREEDKKNLKNVTEDD